VNPENVAETEVWFKWGDPSIDKETPKQPIAAGNAPIAVSALTEGIRPDSLLCVQLAGEDANVKSPELLATEAYCLTTPAVPPRIVKAPSVSFVRYSAAVMSGLVNPENADSEYFFEYSPSARTLSEQCPNGVLVEPASCAGVLTTSTRKSKAYSPVKAVIEASGLQPDTQYHYRLTAVNKAGVALDENGENPLPEGTFTTAPLPVPQATTGQPTGIDTTSATLIGTVNPDGQQSTYSFEIQTGDGATVKYLPILTASAGAGNETLAETFTVTGLQPGVEYTYRITVRNGFGQTSGAPVSFITQPLIVLKTPPPTTILRGLPGRFPCKPGYVRNKKGRCVHTKKPRTPRHHKARRHKKGRNRGAIMRVAPPNDQPHLWSEG
jgi:hypothetical protein